MYLINLSETTCTSASMRSRLKRRREVGVVNSGSLTRPHCVLGKPVLKKKVKFTVAIVPVQRRRGSTVSADMQTHSVYDGQTHSITFQQTSGTHTCTCTHQYLL